jgi:hypothetical protein
VPAPQHQQRSSRRESPGTIRPRSPSDGDARVRQGRNVVPFFQGARKFKTRYATFGFSYKANLDDGIVWPGAFALKELTATNE